MKIIKNQDGFTLIEILVAIFLTVLATSFIVSFYLFATKFIKSTSTNLDEKQKINRFVFDVSEMLQKSSGFEVNIKGDVAMISLNNQKNITFSKGNISIDNYYSLNDVNRYYLLINLDDGEEVTVDSKNINTQIEKNILANSISTISLEIDYKSKVYKTIYYKPQISSLRFNNIN